MTKSKISILVALLAVGCGGGDFSSSALESGQDSGKDPVSTGGQDGDSGAKGGGGSLTAGTGGSKAAGGSSSAGGDVGDSGTASGGSAGAGSSVGSGGASATGGAAGGGGTASTGGTQSAGGTAASGGTSAAGGTTAAGGTASAGGTTSTGGAAGSGGGQCVPQACANDGQTCGQIDDGCGHKVQCLHQCDASKDQVCNTSSNRCVLSCKTYTDAEKQAICAGKCGFVQDSLCGNGFVCDASNGGVSCGDQYSYCNSTQSVSGNTTTVIGTCDGLKSLSGSSSSCPLAGSQPFPYQGGNSFSTDKIQDDGETGVDCGGPNNPARCAAGNSCLQNSDCLTQACVSGLCANSSFRTKGCTNAFNDVWCCSDNVNGCFRDAALDSACGSKMAGSVGFDCKYTGPRPSSSACVPANPVIPGVTPTQYCCHDWF
jgi:hypothetical protein